MKSKLFLYFALCTFLVACDKYTPKINKLSPNTTKPYAILLPSPSKAGPNFWLAKDSKDAKDSKRFSFHKDSFGANVVAIESVDGGNIYLMTDKGKIIALDGKTFKTLWSKKIDYRRDVEEYRFGAITYDNNQLFITYGDAKILILNAKSGDEIFSKKTETTLVSKPLINNKIIYAASTNNSVYAIEENYGGRVWQYSSFNDSSLGIMILPILYKNTLLVSNGQNKIMVVDLAQGVAVNQINPFKELETFQDNESFLVAQPLVNQDSLYLANNLGQLVKFSLLNNKKLWESKVDEVQHMSICGNVLIVVTSGSQVAGISTETGQVIWVNTLAKDDKSYAKDIIEFSPLLVYNGNIVVAGNGRLFQISAISGQTLNTFEFSKSEKVQSFNVSDNLYMYTNRARYKLVK
jgi:outer membrane protein assembly factor BamB